MRDMKGRWCLPALPAAGRALLLALALLLGLPWAAAAQTFPGGQLAVRSDGFLFWIQGGQRHVVYPAALPDDQLNALPESVPLDATLQPALDAARQIPGALVVRSDGFIFWVQGGERHLVRAASLDDDAINALPEGVPLNAALQLGPQPPLEAFTQPPGSTPSVPLPLGQSCRCTIIRATGQRSDFQISITDVQRDAWARLRSTNPSNQQPRPGSEYVMVTLNITYIQGPSDLPVSFNRFDFVMVDSNGVVHSPAFVFEPQPFVSQTTYPGSQVGGMITFEVPRGDQGLLLVWRYNSDRPYWFSIA